MPSKTFVQISPKAKRTRIRPINVSQPAERDEVHVDAPFCNLEEIKHYDQVIPAGLVDSDGTAVGRHLLEVAEITEKGLYPWHDEGKVP